MGIYETDHGELTPATQHVADELRDLGLTLFADNEKVMNRLDEISDEVLVANLSRAMSEIRNKEGK